MTAASEYEYEDTGATIKVRVHPAGATREPRVRWQVGDQRGDCGYVHYETADPVLRLEEGETAHLAGQLVSAIPVPREIGEALETEYEELGTVVPEGNRITADPTAFPAEIAGFDRVGWENERNVMWYCRGDRSSPRAYQIECGKLVFRAQEWANGPMSKQELINHYDLTTG
jgi:hypothetical protein